MLRVLVPLLILTAGLLAGCEELPLMEGTISPAARARAAPDLIPLDPILAEGRRRSRAEIAQGPLQARGAALSTARVADPGTEGLADRGRELRERAARLKAREV